MEDNHFQPKITSISSTSASNAGSTHSTITMYDLTTITQCVTFTASAITRLSVAAFYIPP